MGRGVGSIPSQWRLMPTWAEKGTVPSLVEETCPQMLVTEEAFCYSCKKRVLVVDRESCLSKTFREKNSQSQSSILQNQRW